MKRRFRGSAALLGLAALVGGCDGSRDEGPPDLVLILVAGLRADPPGEPGVEADFVSRIPGEVRLRSHNAYVQSVSTYLSLGSMLTGRYPSTIPLCGFTEQGHQDKSDRPWCAHIPEDRPTLPEVLSIYGYRTAFFSTRFQGVDVLGGEFDTYRAFNVEYQVSRTPWTEYTEAVKTWWSETADSPRLLTLLVTDLLVPLPLPAATEDGLVPQPLMGEGPEGAGQPPAEKLVEEYEDMVSRFGNGFAALLGELDSDRPRWVVLSAPHGISLDERSGSAEFPTPPVFHTIILDRTARVPLAVLGPEGEPTREVQQPVEAVDLLPTLLGRTEARLPANLPGQDLLAPGFEEDPDASAYMEFGDMLALRQGEHLLTFRAMIHHAPALSPDITVNLKRRINARFYHLHDVTVDPMQERELLREQPEVVREMRDELLRIRTGPAAPHERALDPERLLELRMTASEGYW